MIYKILKLKPKELFMVILGTGLLAIGIEWFENPLGIVTGGVAGASIIVSHVFETLFNFSISLSVLNILFNIPIFILSGVQKGFKFVTKALFGTLSLSLWLFLFQMIPNVFDVKGDILVAAILTGLFCGMGIGIVLRAGASSGGGDMLATTLNFMFPRFSISIILFTIDATIICVGLFVFGIINTVYSIIAVFISYKIVDNILSGLRFAKAVWIMSKSTELISETIIKELGRGNTGIPYQGMYTKQQRHMLFVVVRPKELPKLKNIISKTDPNAFIIICPAQEVLGKGFLEN